MAVTEADIQAFAEFARDRTANGGADLLAPMERPGGPKKQDHFLQRHHTSAVAGHVAGHRFGSPQAIKQVITLVSENC